MIKANLVHLGTNMWGDWDHPDWPFGWGAQPSLRFDEIVWRKVIDKMSKCGMNALLLDLADGVRYKSHPEIAVENAWTVDKLKDELQRCRDLGLEVLPKLNFSATHDIWLKEYSRMVSTKKYYQVCGELIQEAIEIFDGPRFFHLGMDEEGDKNQLKMLYMVVRHGELWWHDLNLLVDFVEKNNSQAWVWSDKGWHCEPEEFFANMPKSAVQSNWYYWDVENPGGEARQKYVDFYLELDQHGYKQIPAGIGIQEAGQTYNIHSYPELVKFCTEQISQENLLGFLQTSWIFLVPENAEKIMKSIEITKGKLNG